MNQKPNKLLERGRNAIHLKHYSQKNITCAGPKSLTVFMSVFIFSPFSCMKGSFFDLVLLVD